MDKLKKLWPRRYVYPALGALAAQAVPLGLLFGMRLAMHQRPSWTYLVNEVDSQSITYHYVGITATLVIMVLGFLLGRREDQLRAALATDELTGLGNGDAFEAALVRDHALAMRQRAPLAVLMLEVDRLPLLEETRGKAAVAEALRQVAGALRTQARRTDTCCRVAPGRFGLVLPSSNVAAAEHLVERVRAHLAALPPSASLGRWSIALSAGASDLDSADGRTSFDLFEAAEAQLDPRARTAAAPLVPPSHGGTRDASIAA